MGESSVECPGWLLSSSVRVLVIKFSASIFSQYSHTLTVYWIFSNYTDPQEEPECKSFARILAVREFLQFVVS